MKNFFKDEFILFFFILFFHFFCYFSLIKKSKENKYFSKKYFILNKNKIKDFLLKLIEGDCLVVVEGLPRIMANYFYFFRILIVTN